MNYKQNEKILQVTEKL